MLVLMARGVLAACLLLVLQSPAIRFDSGRSLFLLESWPGAAQLPADLRGETFTISVDADGVPPLLGQYRIENGTLVFAPQFSLQPGMRYRAVARVPGMAPITTVVSIPKPDVKPSTVVAHVYPSMNVLPENQLKFYIHFSASMARGFAYDQISLLDETGAKVDAPFLELGEELWDPEARRFTLFFDPGRIKRGLVSQQELGAALHEGKRYTLVIGKGWKDAAGNPLVAEFRKSFRVGAADRKPVDVKTWNIRKPASGSKDAVTVTFPEPMDNAILQRELDIVNAAGAAVQGSIAVGPDEKSWILTPDAPWKKGTYSLRVGTSIADLAGNMVDRPFEIDVFEQVDQSLERVTRSIPFTVN